VDLVQVDVVEAETPQRRVDRREDVLAGEAAAVGPGVIGKYTFVAITSSSRESSFGTRRPVTISLPPCEYMSAVSKNVTPPSTARRTIGSAAASSSIQGREAALA
jgi:hypothetical protein